MTKSRADKEAAFWDRFAKYYDRFMSHIYQGQYKDILKMIDDELGKDKMVLEIGTGTGKIAIDISPKAKKVIACDLSPHMIKLAEEKAHAKQINNIAFSVQDAYYLDFPDNSFDVVVACNMLHVVQQPGKVLSSIKRVLKQDGVVVVPTYCHGQNFSSRTVSKTMGIVGFRAYSRWSADSLQAFLEDQGYIVIKNFLLKSTPPLLYIVCKKI
ncbi:class I SAM-dependent methyltransferase [Desulfoscipio sp. XC116]|uniref:class I SAM-dependent methyltransferase n=1 Tax=Desulfoscipio sp. XC116 TaxID=3144975 RepID=UPI00325ADF68